MTKIEKILLLFVAIFSIVLIFGLTQNANAQYYNYNSACIANSYQACSDNSLYWYDSCGNRQNVIQYCSNGCYNNICYNNNNYNNNNNNYSNYGNCTYHAYRLCVGNSIYWYSSCNQQQDIYTICSNGLTCQYGQCVNYINPAPNPNPNPYNAYASKACYNNSVYWYDSLGVISGLFKNCNDNNTCTIDSCSTSTCTNELKCDGTTCAVSSNDYKTYCNNEPVNNCGNGLCEPDLNENNQTCQQDCMIETNNTDNLSVNLFVKKDLSAVQWQKEIQAGSNNTIYFMANINNYSSNPIDNIVVSANIPSEVYSLGNLQIGGVAVSGDIVSGINIGNIDPNSTKSITFEGKTQNVPPNIRGNANVYANIDGNSDDKAKSDITYLNFTSTQNLTAAAPIYESSVFWEFLRKWYLWIIAGLVIVLLFIIIFKRFSSDV